MAKLTGRFVPQLVRLDQKRAEQWRADVLVWAAEAPELAAEMLALIDRRTASSNAWRFVLFGPFQNREVMRWIGKHAIRPRVSYALWPEFPCRFNGDTGEILMTRAQMMEVAGASSAHVSEALSEFVRIGALVRRKEGREIRWFMNPCVATCLSGVARDEAQRVAPALLTTRQDSLPAS